MDKNKDSTHSTDITVNQVKRHHSRPSFESDLFVREFSSYICKAGKLYQHTLLQEDSSKVSVSQDLIKADTPGNGFSNKKKKLVNALGSANQLMVITLKEDGIELNNNPNEDVKKNKHYELYINNIKTEFKKNNNELNVETKISVTKNCGACHCINF